MRAYPLWLLLFLLLPLGLLWAWGYRRLRRHARILLISTVGCLLLAVPWDLLAVHDHIWYFTSPYILGSYWLGLPVEEYFYISGVGLLAACVTVLLWERYGARG